MRNKLFVLLACLLIFVLTLNPVVTTVYAQAAASNPVITVISIDSTFNNEFDCSFPLVERVTGTVRDTLYFDQNGLVVREFISPQFQGALRVTWTNPETGISLESHEASALMIYYNPDGSFQKLMNQGLTFMVTVPGAGQPLLMDAGRIVIERGQGITLEAGVHQELNTDTAGFCAYLATVPQTWDQKKT